MGGGGGGGGGVYRRFQYLGDRKRWGDLKKRGIGALSTLLRGVKQQKRGFTFFKGRVQTRVLTMVESNLLYLFILTKNKKPKKKITDNIILI